MKPWLRHGLVLGGIGLLGISPILLSLPASFLPQASGCRLGEGSVHPCVWGGRDFGSLLYNLSVSFWLLFFTGPLGVLATGVYLLVGLIRRTSALARK